MSEIRVRMKMASSQTSTVWFTEQILRSGEKGREHVVDVEQVRRIAGAQLHLPANVEHFVHRYADHAGPMLHQHDAAGRMRGGRIVQSQAQVNDGDDGAVDVQ